jgi:hypothetical protein
MRRSYPRDIMPFWQFRDPPSASLSLHPIEAAAGLDQAPEMADALRQKDWGRFAALYNGSISRDQYSKKLADA